MQQMTPAAIQPTIPVEFTADITVDLPDGNPFYGFLVILGFYAVVGLALAAVFG